MNTSISSQNWKLDRSVNIGDLVVFITLVAAGLAYVMHQDQRSTRSEVEIITLKETDVRHEGEIKEIKVDLASKMDRLESKFDRILEGRRR